MHFAFTEQVLHVDDQLKLIMQLCPLEANFIPVTKIELSIQTSPTFTFCVHALELMATD